jgi:hypothetical protein
MDMQMKQFSTAYRLACMGDALLLPACLVFWYRVNYADGVGIRQGESIHRPGLLISALTMVLVWRAVLKIEQALRSPWAYRWDLERAVRWYVLIVAMGLAIRLLG